MWLWETIEAQAVREFAVAIFELLNKVLTDGGRQVALAKGKLLKNFGDLDGPTQTIQTFLRLLELLSQVGDQRVRGDVDDPGPWAKRVSQLCYRKQMFASQNESVEIHKNTLMKKITLLKTQVMILLVVCFVFLVLSFGFGFFFGRYEQIELNKSGLQVVPDVNCRLGAEVDGE